MQLTTLLLKKVVEELKLSITNTTHYGMIMKTGVAMKGKRSVKQKVNIGD